MIDHLQFIMHPYKWHLMRFMHFLECLEKPAEFVELTRYDEVERQNTYTMLHVEAIVSFLQFIELLPAYLQNLRNLDGIQMALQRYQVSDTETFFKRLSAEGVGLTSWCLGYDLMATSDPEMTQRLQKSAEAIHLLLLRSGEFYGQSKGLLNAYKHGLRVFPAEADSPDCLFFYLPDRNSDTQGVMVHWSPERTDRLKRAFALLVGMLMDLTEMFRAAREMVSLDQPREISYSRFLFDDVDPPELR